MTRLAIFVLGMSAGCGSSSATEHNAVSGTVEGTSLSAASAVAIDSPVGATAMYLADGGVRMSGGTPATLVTISTAANTCSHVSYAGTTSLNLHVPAPLGKTGTFTIGATASTMASAGFGVINANCQTGSVAEEASSGTITVATSSTSLVTGSFDLTFTGGHLTGTFDAPVCPPTLFSTPLTDAGDSICK